MLTIEKEKIETLYSAEEIDAKISQIASQINNDYKDSKSLVVIGVLKGAAFFCADLVRKLELECQIEFIRLASYQTGTQSSGDIRVYDLALPDLSDRDVLIIEDIVDSGRTANFLKQHFSNQVAAKSFKIATLLNKPSKRLEEFKDLEPDYCCFEVDDKFILGFGLDYEQRFRELPYLGYIENLS